MSFALEGLRFASQAMRISTGGVKLPFTGTFSALCTESACLDSSVLSDTGGVTVRVSMRRGPGGISLTGALASPPAGVKPTEADETSGHSDNCARANCERFTDSRPDVPSTGKAILGEREPLLPGRDACISGDWGLATGAPDGRGKVTEAPCAVASGCRGCVAGCGDGPCDSVAPAVVGLPSALPAPGEPPAADIEPRPRRGVRLSASKSATSRSAATAEGRVPERRAVGDAW